MGSAFWHGGATCAPVCERSLEDGRDYNAGSKGGRRQKILFCSGAPTWREIVEPKRSLAPPPRSLLQSMLHSTAVRMSGITKQKNRAYPYHTQSTTCEYFGGSTLTVQAHPKYMFVVYHVYLSNSLVCCHVLWLGRESSWLTCLPHSPTRCHTHMSSLMNVSPSLHCLGSTVRSFG